MENQITELLAKIKEMHKEIDFATFETFKTNILKNENKELIIDELLSILNGNLNIIKKYTLEEKKETTFSEEISSAELDKYEKETIGMEENEKAQYLRLHGKNPSQIMMIMLALDERKQKKNIPVQNNVVNQKVLVKLPDKKLMSGFVNTLFLSFLIGALSGTVFFIMLQIILKNL